RLTGRSLVRTASEATAAATDQVVAVVTLGLDRQLLCVIRDDRARQPERVPRPEGARLPARERARDEDAEPARELVGPRPAGDDDDLGGGARAVSEPEVPAAAVGSKARHARGDAERRGAALRSTQEAVGDEQRLGIAARRLVAADRE